MSRPLPLTRTSQHVGSAFTQMTTRGFCAWIVLEKHLSVSLQTEKIIFTNGVRA
jgi:hypothetical protein